MGTRRKYQTRGVRLQAGIELGIGKQYRGYLEKREEEEKVEFGRLYK